MPSHQPDDASIVVDNNDDQIFLPKKKRLDPRIVLSGIMMFILVSSSGLALVAQNRDTDNRSSASEGEYSNLPISEPCVETPRNLIKNPSFETNFTNWAKGRLINRAVLTSGSPHCQKNVRVTFLRSEDIGSDAQKSLSQRVEIKPNTKYKISLWARTNDELASLEAYVLSRPTNNQGSEDRLVLTDIYETFFLSNQWQKFEISEKSKPEFSSADSILYLVASAPKGKSVYIDNVVLVELPSQSPSPYPTFKPSGAPTPTKMITGFPTPTPAYFPTPHSDPTPTRVPTNYPTPQP